MLVLTRKINQQIRLGEDITITVLRVQGNSIRIGVEAPRSVRVLRGELQPLDGASESDAGAAAEGQAPAGEIMEFELQDLLSETADDAEASSRGAADTQVYQMRSKAPLSHLLRSPAASAAAMASLSLQ